MGAKKDINRVRELIFGKDIERFEKRFDALETQQKAFEKEMRKELNHLSAVIENTKEKYTQKYTKLSREIHQNSTKNTQALRSVDLKIQAEANRTLEHMKALKTELKMYVKAKLNSFENTTISHTQLSEMFATLAEELQDNDTKHKHAK